MKVQGQGSELSEEFEVKVGVQQGSVLSPCALFFTIAVDVVTEKAKEGLMHKMLHADYLVLISETMEGLRGKFWKWKEAFEGKGVKVTLGKTKVVLNGAEGKVYGYGKFGAMCEMDSW